MIHAPRVEFRPERLDVIAGSEATHFWHAPRRELLLDLVCRRLVRGARVVDVGCGTGTLATALGERGFDVHGIDPWAGARNLDPSRFTTACADALPLAAGSMDAVCTFDLLEHVDDELALAEMHRVLAPDGLLFASVPAYAWLWSARDIVAGHRRRYTRRMLRSRVEAAGFRIERLFGYQCLLLPLLVVSRLWARMRGTAATTEEDRPGRLVNALLLKVNQAEVAAGRWVRPPCGSSLVLVARKTG